jgi:hypothetical protein
MSKREGGPRNRFENRRKGGKRCRVISVMRGYKGVNKKYGISRLSRLNSISRVKKDQ